MLPFLVIAAFVASATANPLNGLLSNGRIVGGNDTQIETYPYQISLEFYDIPKCGGSIVSAHYVVTAAHCVKNLNTETYTIRAGTSVEGKGGSVHQVEKIIRHENYTTRDGFPVNDIALIRVLEPFHFDDTRQPINLFEFNEESPAGDFAVVTGWGNIAMEGWQSPRTLQVVSIPIVAKDLCNKAYKEYVGLPKGQICAAYYRVGGKDACNGDSGGPLAINGRLAGIVSWGFACGDSYYPGVYTEISYFRNWINKHVEF